MTPASLIELSCIPLLIAGGIVLWLSFQRTGRTKRSIWWMGFSLIAASLAILIVRRHATILMVLNEELAILLMGFVGAVGVCFPAFRAAVVRKKGKARDILAIALVGVPGLASLLLGGWYLVGDFLLDHQRSQGAVTRKHIHRSASIKAPSIVSYYVDLDGKGYQTTEQIYRAAQVGSFYHAEIGTASEMIFELLPEDRNRPQ